MKSNFVFVQKSSNGDAMVSVNLLARRFCVMSLADTKQTYKGFGCQFLKCPYPHRHCKDCLHKHSASVIF